LSFLYFLPVWVFVIYHEFVYQFQGLFFASCVRPTFTLVDNVDGKTDERRSGEQQAQQDSLREPANVSKQQGRMGFTKAVFFLLDAMDRAGRQGKGRYRRLPRHRLLHIIWLHRWPAPASNFS
jgi:hypothetical protein